MVENSLLKFFRRDRLPLMWCPGCGIGQIWSYTAQAIDELRLDVDKVLWAGGIGCSGRMCGYWIGDSFHTLHGRALTFATGVKLARPDLTVIVHTGDGDSGSIGGNHLIHAARRNIGLTVICVNNLNYGMTGNQVSPTTPFGIHTPTTPFGNLEKPMDLCGLVIAAGGTYVARWTTYHAHQCVDSIKKAITHKGFSFVEIISQCIIYGRRSGFVDAYEMMEWFRNNSVKWKEDVAKISDTSGKFVVGEFIDMEKPEFSELQHELIKRAEKRFAK